MTFDPLGDPLEEEQEQPSLDEIISSYDGDDLELRAMIERRGAVVELMRHPGFRHLKEFIESEINKKSQRIVLGRMKDHEEYLAETGWCQGAIAAFTAIDRLDALVAARVANAQGFDSLADYGNVGDDPYDDGFPANDSPQEDP